MPIVRYRRLVATNTIRVGSQEAYLDRFAIDLRLVHRTGKVGGVVEAMLSLCSSFAGIVTGGYAVSGGYLIAL